jgi:adenosylhomocysteinase
MPRVRQALADLPELKGVRLAVSMHLDLKMLPLMEGLLAKGAELFVTTCNPTTVNNAVVQRAQAAGAIAEAFRDMPDDAYHESIRHALDWGPTHLCEMGADLTVALHRRSDNMPAVKASLEATGSGISHLDGLALHYPVFNWDDLPVKEGLHNRRMVGLTAWHTFFNRTRLTLHGRRVLVVGYGSVGRGVADSARAYGGMVTVAERDPARAIEAMYAGWDVRPLDEAVREADVIVTATGARGVIHSGHLPLLKDGVFIMNVGHRPEEIEVDALRVYPCEEAMPFVEGFDLGGRTVYLIAGGSMMNLTAGPGDSMNAFDVTLALMVSGIGHIVGAGEQAPPGVHILPREVWLPYTRV